jgi:hypothetical protein
MKTNDDTDFEDDLRPEYDLASLTGRVRGKYAERSTPGTNVVRLAPDVAAAFPNEAAVNQALRMLIEIAKAQVQSAPAD